VDVVLFVVESGIFNEADEKVIALLPSNVPVILVVNKKDSIKDKLELTNFVKEVERKFNFTASTRVSAKHHQGVHELLIQLRDYIPLGEFLYPEDQLTDRPSNFLASEIIREKLFRYLGQELPYNLAVEIDSFELKDRTKRISATIIVDKDNQKGIVIGKGGERLKKISTEARKDMEHLFNSHVFLEVWVKVRSGFADQAKFLDQFK
jgi:GTP-binding protein Era